MDGGLSFRGFAHQGELAARRGRHVVVRRHGSALRTCRRHSWVDAVAPTGRTAPYREAVTRSGRIEGAAAFLLEVEETPDITLAELQGAAERARPVGRDRHGVAVLRTPWDQALKKTAHAAEQERPDVAARRLAWLESQPDLDPNRLVIIDEAGASTKMVRLRGRSISRGQRCRVR